MNKWVELLLGLIIIIGLILFSWSSNIFNWTLFGKDFDFLHAGWIFLKGGIFWLLAIIGMVLILLGINDMRE